MTYQVQRSNYDAARPFVVVAPAGVLGRIKGHYATKEAAQRAARRWNRETGRA